MTLKEVKQKLIDVLHKIQSDSGLTEQVITGDTRPLDEVEGFDSLISLEATVMLAGELNIEIPNHINIFLSKDGQAALTINEVVRVIYELCQGSKQ